MTICFRINGQHIARTDTGRIVADSRHYLDCKFTFTPDWDNVIKTAVFEKDNVVFHVVLTEDGIASTAMPVFSAGIWKVSVFGGDRITTDTAALYVAESGYADGTAPQAPASSVYDTLSTLISESISKTETLESRMDDVQAGSLHVEDDTLVIGV